MIDFRDHDQCEHAATLEQRLQQPIFDLRRAQQIREHLHEKREAEAFAQAEKRMRAGR